MKILAPILLLASAVASAEVSDEIVLNNTNGPPFTTPAGDGFLDQIIGVTFHRIGRRVRLVVLPPERGLRLANQSRIDGDLTRIADMETQYPNLVRVPEKILDWVFAAFTSRPELCSTQGWSGLLPYAIGFMKGWKIAETQLAGAKQHLAVDDHHQLFRLLVWKRVDLVVYSQEMGDSYLRDAGLGNIRRCDAPLETRPMYIYLHRRHQSLVTPLTEALRDLKADGTYNRLYRTTVMSQSQR